MTGINVLAIKILPSIKNMEILNKFKCYISLQQYKHINDYISNKILYISVRKNLKFSVLVGTAIKRTDTSS